MPTLSLVIPALNESGRLPASLRSIARYFRGARLDKVEVIVVDDGSTDETAEAAARAQPLLHEIGASVRVLRNAGNRGKGYSVRRGMLEAEHDWVLFSDADLSAPIEEFQKLMQVAMDGGHDIAIGSRAIDRSLIGVRQPCYRETVGRLFNLNVRLLTGLDIADTQCGFKLFSRPAARRIARLQRTKRFGFDVEQLYLARKLGLSVAEVPVRWNNEENSTVTLRDGVQAFVDVWKVAWWNLRGRYS